MAARLALLVVDLEGIAGVDCIPALIAATPEHARARELVTAEVNACVEGLVGRGFEAVVVSDSHRSGSGEPNILASRLHPRAELDWREDAYEEALFERASAVACLGMHAPAPREAFAAHTVDLLDDWRVGGASVSEARLVLCLAAEAGLPLLFATGDDVLERELAGAVPYLRTKVSRSRSAASSVLSPAQVAARLAELAASARAEPARAPGSELSIRFKSRVQADVAQRAGGDRTGPYEVAFRGGTFRDRYRRAFAASGAVSSANGERIRAGPGDPAFSDDVAALLELAPADPEDPGVKAPLDAVRERLLQLTAADDEASVSERAFILALLERLAPALRTPRLDGEIAGARRRAAAARIELSPGLDPDLGVARLTAALLGPDRGARIAAGAERYVRALIARGELLAASVARELACAAGAKVGPVPATADAALSRIAALYSTTTAVLSSACLSLPPSEPLRVRADLLLAYAAWAASCGHVALAAEMAVSLQAIGERDHPATARLLRRVAEAVRPDGTVEDASFGDPAALAARATGMALVAFAAARPG